MLENAIGDRLPDLKTPFDRRSPARWGDWLYRLSLERGYFDSLLSDFVVRPFVALFEWCDGIERRWTELVAGGSSRPADQTDPSQTPLEDLQ